MRFEPTIKTTLIKYSLHHHTFTIFTLIAFSLLAQTISPISAALLLMFADLVGRLGLRGDIKKGIDIQQLLNGVSPESSAQAVAQLQHAKVWLERFKFPLETFSVPLIIFGDLWLIQLQSPWKPVISIVLVALTFQLLTRFGRIELQHAIGFLEGHKTLSAFERHQVNSILDILERGDDPNQKL